ncbi:MAG: DUF58 domain-containing protein [Halobacteriaceae archaeon]
MTADRPDRVTVAILAVGLIAAALGFLGVLAPAIGSRYFGGIPVMNVVGLAALGLAAHSVVRRYGYPITRTILPAVRPNTTATRTGATVDDALRTRVATARAAFRDATIALLAVDTDRESAETSVADGSWTEDVAAARFLTPSVAPPDSLRRRLRDRLSDDPRVLREARAAVAALLDHADVDPPSRDPGPTPTSASDRLEDLDEGATATHRTHRWTGVAALPAFAVAVAVFTRSPGSFLVAGVGLALLGIVRHTATTPPTPSIAVERRVDDPTPHAAGPVRITIAITNTGDTRIDDIRLCDGVPPALVVDRGVPSLATSLAPGATVETSYAVRATRGVHRFDPPYVVVRNHTGTQEHLSRPPVEGPDRIECVPPLSAPEPPERARTTPYAGRVATKTGGQGVEFYGTREYRHGDPLARVNWKRLASTGDLSTIQFRQEQAAAVVILIDTRASARVAPTVEDPHAVERSVDAARQLAGSLLDAGDQVGVGTLGPATHWTPPGAGAAHRATLRRTLAEAPAFSPRPADGGFEAAAAVATFRARLTEGTNVILCTPLVDDWAASVARRLAARTAVTVVSPDPTSTATLGARLAAVDRARRITTLRSAGVPVIDWGPDDRLATALTRRARR